MLHRLGDRICSVDVDLEIFNKSVQHILKDVSSKIWNIPLMVFFSVNLEKFSVLLLDTMKIGLPLIYLTYIYEDHPINIQTIAISLKP